MRALPAEDDAFGRGVGRIYGRVVHDFHLFQVKTPGESRGEWDVYKLVATVPGLEAFRPLSGGEVGELVFASPSLTSGYWNKTAEMAAALTTAGIGVRDAYRGETVTAIVGLKPGQEVEPAELTAFCRERMAAYKYPRLVEIVEDLPKTPTGKIMRRMLRDV